MSRGVGKSVPRILSSLNVTSLSSSGGRKMCDGSDLSVSSFVVVDLLVGEFVIAYSSVIEKDVDVHR
jgi:hypothetical protein